MGLVGTAMGMLRLTKVTTLQTILFIVAVVTVSVLDLLSLSVFPALIDVTFNANEEPSNDGWQKWAKNFATLVNIEYDAPSLLSAAFVSFYLFRLLVSFMLSKAIVWFGLSVFNSMRKRLIRRLLYDQNKSKPRSSSDLIYSVQNLTSIVSGLLTQFLQSCADTIFVIAILLFVLKTFSVFLVPMVLTLTIASFLFIVAQNQTIQKAGATENDKGIDLIVSLSELHHGMKEIKSYEKEQFFETKIFKRFDVTLQAVFTARVLALYPKYFFEFLILSLLLVWFATSFSAKLSYNDLLTQGGILTIVAIKLVPLFKSIVNFIQQLKYREDAVNRLLQMDDWTEVPLSLIHI